MLNLLLRLLEGWRGDGAFAGSLRHGRPSLYRGCGKGFPLAAVSGHSQHQSLEDRSVPPGHDYQSRQDGGGTVSRRRAAKLHRRTGATGRTLFHFEDGTPLSRPALVREVRLALSAAGMDPSPFSGHSFWIGAATLAATAGVEDVIIKTLGRWRSSAYQQYVQLQRSDLAAVSLRLAPERS